MTFSIQVSLHYSMCKFTSLSDGNKSLINLTSMPPNCSLSNMQQFSIKENKAWLTYLFVTNANGSLKLSLLIIRKVQKPWVFKNKMGS